MDKALEGLQEEANRLSVQLEENRVWNKSEGAIHIIQELLENLTIRIRLLETAQEND